MTAFDEWGNPTPWRLCSWRDRIVLVLFNAVMWGLVFPAMLLGAFVLVGMIIEGQAQRTTAIESCQKHAVTPYEYHQCR